LEGGYTSWLKTPTPRTTTWSDYPRVVDARVQSVR